jgi:hypothetical protein
MSETPFIITIDTEGDNLWARPREISTHNALYIPRFQSLCERHGLRPVYLVNYEMAMSDAFVEFARDAAARNACEIGMHLHAWNSPPLYALTDDDFRHQPYLTEYPASVMKEKVRTLTALLEDRFGQRMVSHRAGRWSFDGRYASILIDAGYRVDCSVTPGIDWRPKRGAPGGRGGPDYRQFPSEPYFLAPSNISAPARGRLLEVPMTVHLSAWYRRAPWLYQLPVVRRAVKKFSPPPRWLCPSPLHEKPGSDAMFELVRQKRRQGVRHLEFMLHSSELMPGGSPVYRRASDIERLYEQLEMLFEELSGWCRGITLKDFDAQLRNSLEASVLRPRQPVHPEPVLM